ncbi:MAG: TauD/TfdA family dioxygenase [Hyphomicrobiaceae bacterium]|nr:TauD/TfdA family dioxygenase [Hyphomicrobiaceae bacterium]
MSGSRFRIRSLGAIAAVEITGVDLAAPLDAQTFAEIEAAFDRSGVIVIPGQCITPAQQLAFARRFGDIEINHNSAKYGLPEQPEIYKISNITKDGKPIGSRRAGENWHSDMIYAARPPRATMLYALEVPELHGLSLGDTAFANAAMAYEGLPDAMKRRIEGLKGVFDFTRRKRSEVAAAAAVERYPPIQHPIVRTHPRTGAKCLYINRDDCGGIAGLPFDEAEALIVALSDHVIKPEFLYRHRWRKGDVVMWDNCTMQHKAIIDYDLPQRRLLHRLTIAGTPPV